MTLDETKGNQDDKTSEDQRGTSEKDPETLTEEDKTRKAVSDALSAAGRDAKAMEAREKGVKEALARAEKLQVDIRKAESERAEREYRDALQRAGDDPLAKSKVELDRSLKLAKVELANKEAELSKREEELTDARKVAADSTKERNAREIASKYEVNPETLKLTDGSPEAMEALAKTLSGKETPTLIADSGKTSGGSGRIPTTKKGLEEWMESHTQAEFEENSAEINKMIREGKVK